MLFAFLLGLSGSLGHCVGMCGGITLLFSRQGMTRGWRLVLLHLGRVTTYGLLGLLAGSVGAMASSMMSGHTHHHAEGGDLAAMLLLPQVRSLQGGVALFAALVTFYFAIALTGYLPSPEIVFGGLTRHWGRLFRQLATSGEHDQAFRQMIAPYVSGLFWGLLPCGMVLTALLTAVTALSPAGSALMMVAYGLGTWPMLLAIGLLSRHTPFTPQPWMRYAAAVLVMMFGVQLLLRGMAFWGMIGHATIGELMLW